MLAWRLENRGLEPPKSRPGASQIEAQTLQNRAWRPPKSSLEPSKTPFLKTSNLRWFFERPRRAVSKQKIRFLSELDSILEAHDPPKSRPKPEKIDVEKQHVFGIDCFFAQT